MMDWIRRLRRSNKGSSLVITVVAISFVAILGTAIMAATFANLNTKVVNYKSKKNFYNAESALEEIYSGVSKESFEKLNEAYLETITSLAGFTSGNPNSEANLSMRNKYMTSVKMMIKNHNGGVDPFDSASDKSGLKSWMDGFITHNYVDSSTTKYAYVESIGEVSEIYAADGVTLDGFEIADVSVVYVSTTDDYFSSVTVDMNIGYPDVSFNFIDNRTHLNTYLNYAIIGMQGVNAGSGVVVNKAGVYAGTNIGGLDVNHNGSLTLQNGSLLVTLADVDIKEGATLNVNGSKVWSRNINVDNDSYLTTDSTATLYLADDLNLEGISSSHATLAGNYYGFGYQGASWQAEPVGSTERYPYIVTPYSSAIVVNGNNARLDMSGLSTMLLSGRAYIKVGVGHTSGYMTGDSSGLRMIQDIYLVPAAYINENYSNPKIVDGTSITDWRTVVNYRALKNNNLYKGLIDEAVPVVAINDKVDGVEAVYYYINFKDNNCRTSFVKRLIPDSSPDYEDCEGWDELHRITKGALDNLFDSKLPPSSAITAGNLFAVGSGTIDVSSATVQEGTAGEVSMKSRCDDKAHRYKVLDQFLYDMGDDASDNPGQSLTPVDNGASIVIPIINSDGTLGVGEMQTIEDDLTYYNRVIDTTKWDQADTIIAGAGGTVIDGIYVNSSVPSPNPTVGTAVLVPDRSGVHTTVSLSSLGVTQGVILANNSEIYVDTNFEGLIITNGKVSVGDGVTVTANSTLTENTIKYDKVLSQFFIAYQGANLSGLSAADVSNEDLLVYDNWRKNYGK